MYMMTYSGLRVAVCTVLVVASMAPLHAQQAASLADLDLTSGITGTRLINPEKRGTIWLDQPPNQVSGIFSDLDCGACQPTSLQQVVAENFILDTPNAIAQVVVWGVYAPNNTIPEKDTFTVTFRSDNNGEPGELLSTETDVPHERVDTGLNLFAMDEHMFTLTLTSPITLTPGRYWVEVFNNTTESPDTFTWETGHPDPVYGLFNAVFSVFYPNPSWRTGNPVTDFALQLIGPDALPVELTRFTATALGSTIRLQWTTASEINNAGFDVEISTDGTNFIQRGHVEGAGTTTEQQTYTYDLDALVPGNNFVRIKQIDFDGTFSYSRVVEVNTDIPLDFMLETAYPNPFRVSVTIPFVTEADLPVQLDLFDALGRKVARIYDGIAPAGVIQHVHLEADGLTGGTYFYRLTTPRGTASGLLTLIQ